MPDNNAPRNLSRHQYRTLKFIRSRRVTMGTLRRAHANTLGSLGYNDYVRRTGLSDDAEVLITTRGEIALAAYEEAGMNERQHEADVTERCLRLLKHVRRIAEMSKSA